MPLIDPMKPELTRAQRVFMHTYGYVYVGTYQREGWNRPIEHYAFVCKKHGVVVDYPHGHRQRLDCPKCMKENKR